MKLDKYISNEAMAAYIVYSLCLAMIILVSAVALNFLINGV